MNLNNLVLVVEGKTDEAFIKSFLDVEIIKTNGSAISHETLELIKNVSEKKTVVVLTDPDFPGTKIRNTIADYAPLVKHAFVRKEVSIKKNKVGVAESTKEEILAALSNLKDFSQVLPGNLIPSDLYELGLIGKANSEELREKISNELRLGFCNGKTFLKRLNYLGISKKDIQGLIHG